MPGDCQWCGEPILDAERLRDVPHMPLHKACAGRAVFGSIGHQLGLCSCFGGTTEDPPMMTKREAAFTAWAMFTKGREIRVLPMRERATMRPKRFSELPPELQWEVDKALGILDWAGD